MLNIAITGGIGSGKTQASDHLRDLGYKVIDADAMAREITAPGGKALPLIRERFGGCLFDDDGNLDRAAVREMIFSDPSKRALYESCTTQLILDDIAGIRSNAEKSGDKVIFYDIPLLYETGTEDEYDIVWVVTADKDIRVKRVMERSDIEAAAVESFMKSQITEEEKTAKADYVIYNNGSIEDLCRSVDEALKTILK